MKCARIYAEQGELTEEQAERYDELAELAEADVLDEAGEAELQALQNHFERCLFRRSKGLRRDHPACQ